MERLTTAVLPQNACYQRAHKRQTDNHEVRPAEALDKVPLPVRFPVFLYTMGLI
jgi:hypothetical protein